MSHLNTRRKSRSMRHKSNRMMKNHRRSLKHTRKMRRNNKKRHHFSRRHKKNRRKTRAISYRYRRSYGKLKGKSFRGGSGLRSLLPMEITSLGDNIRHGISTVAHDFVGSVYDPPNPMPYKDHAIDTNDKIILPKVADLNRIYNEASSKVSELYA